MEISAFYGAGEIITDAQLVGMRAAAVHAFAGAYSAGVNAAVTGGTDDLGRSMVVSALSAGVSK